MGTGRKKSLSLSAGAGHTHSDSAHTGWRISGTTARDSGRTPIYNSRQEKQQHEEESREGERVTTSFIFCFTADNGQYEADISAGQQQQDFGQTDWEGENES